jgi:integrase
MKLAYEIMYWSGLRVGETLALTKNDILPSRIIDVNKTVSRKEGEDRYYDPKTDKSCRQVPISRFLYNKIIEYTDSLYDLKDTDKIFYLRKAPLIIILTNNAKVCRSKENQSS